MKSDADRKTLLCHKWIQFAFKQNAASSPQMIDKSMAKESIFKADGTYEDAMYDNKLKTTGNWLLNEDQTKMVFTISNVNGKDIPPFSETTKHFNIIILKLTADTLIYGNEFYHGKDRVYDHFDWYFVRKD
jgi:hypothetical protein